MALRLSTGLRNAMLGQKALVSNPLYGTTFSYGDGTGTGGRDQILDSNNGLAIYTPGSKILVDGSTSNDGSYDIITAVAAAIEVAAASLTTEVAGDATILAEANGASLIDLFRNGNISIFSGTQPTSGDTVHGSSELVQITLSSGAFVKAVAANGINLGVSASGTIAKDTGEIWSGVAGATGTAAWFRFYANAKDAAQDTVDGISTTRISFDGTCATSGSQMNMATTAITSGATTTIDSFSITLPAS